MLTIANVLAHKNVTKPVKTWTGTVPPVDSFGAPIATVFIDGRTRTGQWAYMNPTSFKHYGMGLGIGRGQRYVLARDGKWYRSE